MFVRRIKEVREKYKDNNFKGSISSLIIEFGGIEEIIKQYGSIDRFCRDLQNAGYHKSYISRLKRKLKKNDN